MKTEYLGTKLGLTNKQDIITLNVMLPLLISF